MSSFDARIRLPGQTRLPLNVVVDISDDRIKFSKGDKPLGDWSLDEINVDIRSDAFYIKIDEEEIALNVSDSEAFAGALRSRRIPATMTADTNAGQNNATTAKGLSTRLSLIDPEQQFDDVRRRIGELAVDLDDERVSPQEAFGSWLRLLKEINVRHGQGAMPTPLFYRLNTELLDLIPTPPREPNPNLQSVGAGPRL